MAALTGQLTDEQKAMIRKSVYEYEVSKLGGFQRIFPSESSWERYAFDSIFTLFSCDLLLRHQPLLGGPPEQQRTAAQSAVPYQVSTIVMLGSHPHHLGEPRLRPVMYVPCIYPSLLIFVGGI